MTKTNLAVKMNDDALTDYAAGRLSFAKHIIVKCQAEISNDVAGNIAFEEDVAAALMAEGKDVPLSAKFIGNVLEQLPEQGANDYTRKSKSLKSSAPSTLKNMLGQDFDGLKWKSPVPGVSIYDILGDRNHKSGDRLYLLKVKAGMKMPEHSHSGEEWTLILTGGYSTQEQSFSRGDLHIENGDVSHAPHIMEGEDCICLVMTQGPLQMKPLLARILQPLIGI